MSGNKNKPTSTLAPPISVISNKRNIKKNLKHRLGTFQRGFFNATSTFDALLFMGKLINTLSGPLIEKNFMASAIQIRSGVSKQLFLFLSFFFSRYRDNFHHFTAMGNFSLYRLLFTDRSQTDKLLYFSCHLRKHAILMQKFHFVFNTCT